MAKNNYKCGFSKVPDPIFKRKWSPILQAEITTARINSTLYTSNLVPKYHFS